MGIVSFLFGGKKPATLGDEITKICGRLSLLEAKLGLAEILSGLFYVDRSGVNRNNLNEYIEIAVALYIHVNILEGTPKTLSEKGKYRVALTWTVAKASRKKNFMEKHALLASFRIDADEIDDRENLETAIIDLQRAVSK